MNHFFIILLFINFFAYGQSDVNDTDLMQDDTGCKCYCSFKCGPRGAKPEDGDSPFISKKYYSPYSGKGICFCKQRDEDYYEENGCQITEEDETEINCCR